MNKDFCHLHIHTEYSLLDGIIRVEPLMEYLKEKGMSSCAITDHGNLSGAVEFYMAAKKASIKPILGCEVYLTFDEDDLENKNKHQDNMHLVLLAQNKEGWHNLVWLVSNAALNNFYYKPRVCYKHLQGKRASGLIALTACIKGPVAQAGIFKENGEFDPCHNLLTSPFEVLEVLGNTFPNRLYAEIQDHPFLQQQSYNKYLIGAAKDLGLPLVLTTDAHFIKPQNRKLHETIIMGKMGHYVYQEGNCIRSPDDMFDTAVRMGVEEAYWNTLKIAEQCSVKLRLDEYESPAFDITKCDDYQDYLKWEENAKVST